MCVWGGGRYGRGVGVAGDNVDQMKDPNLDYFDVVYNKGPHYTTV